MPFRTLCLLVLLVAPVHAQQEEPTPPNTEPIDVRVFRAVYEADGPLFETLMRGAHVTAYPVFLTAAPLNTVGIFLTDDAPDWRPSYRLALTQATTTVLVFGLKNAVRRPRPYAALDDVTARESRSEDDFDPFSFPSGHAAMSFALATSTSLSYPEWYVAVPSYAWATSVALSRVWLGVHYPTDVLTGALLGSGVGLGVYLLAPVLTPGFLKPDEEPEAPERPAPPTVFFRITF